MRLTFKALFFTEDNLRAIHGFFEDLDFDYELSQDPSESLHIEPLHLLPLKRENSQTIFVLFPVGERRNFLLIRNDKFDKLDRIGLGQKAEVHVSAPFVSRKLSKLRGDLSFVVEDHTSLLAKLKSASLDHAVVEGCFVSEKILAHYKAVKLDSREFGHTAGQGYFAIVGDKSDEGGEVLRRYNNRESIAICNVERKMAKMSKEVVNCHCEIDTNGNIHLWVYNSEGEAHVSQSTRNQIEERALRKLE